MGFKCDICSAEFASIRSLKQHSESIHLGLKPPIRFTCAFCRRGFYCKRHFHQHIRSHVQERPFFCKICDSEFRTALGFKRHVKNHNPDRKKEYKCPLCPKSFFELGHRSKHLGVHTLEKPYKCSICEKSFPFDSKLKMHIRTTHSEVRPFKCDVDKCKATFKTKSNLDRHKTYSHGGNNELPCEICGKQFRNKYSLAQHRRGVHSKENVVENDKTN